MEVIVSRSTESAVKLAATILADGIRAKPNLVLGLATGRTMEAVYVELARMHRQEYLHHRCLSHQCKGMHNSLKYSE